MNNRNNPKLIVYMETDNNRQQQQYNAGLNHVMGFPNDDIYS